MSRPRKHPDQTSPPPGRPRLEWIDPATLTGNPLNWRRHPDDQMAALDELLNDPSVGWAGVLLFNERTGRLIDGHARKEKWIQKHPGEPAPVLVGSWSEEGEKKILATLDPVAALAEVDAGMFKTLTAEMTKESPAIDAVLQRVLSGAGLEEMDPNADLSTELVQLDTKKPPVMTWVLIGLPTVKFGDIAEHVEIIAAVPGVKLETVVNNG